MDLLQTLVLLFSCALCISCIFHILKPYSGHQKSPKLPPGPKPFPVIGNILELGHKPHQSLATLSKIYGPLMHLKLGSNTTIVVSSPEIAKIVLQKHDKHFSNRTVAEAIRAFDDHHKFSVGWLPVDHQWRKLHKLLKDQMLSAPRLDASQGLRTEKLHQLWEYVNKCCKTGEAVDIDGAAFTTSLNLISATLFSVDFAAFGSSSKKHKDMVLGLMEIIAKPNLADYFPILKLVDPQGIFGKSRYIYHRFVEIFDEIISERLQRRRGSSDFAPENDMLEALLDLNQREESELSLDD